MTTTPEMAPLDLTTMISQLAKAHAAAVEEMCERSLTDSAGRGVLVTERLDLATNSWRATMELSADVPYGQIHTRHA